MNIHDVFYQETVQRSREIKLLSVMWKLVLGAFFFYPGLVLDNDSITITLSLIYVCVILYDHVLYILFSKFSLKIYFYKGAEKSSFSMEKVFECKINFDNYISSKMHSINVQKPMLVLIQNYQ